MKSYTNLKQSKKLAEILPVESADMFYRDSNSDDVKLMWEHVATKVTTPCWSLAALLNILNYPTLMHEFCGSEKEKWFLTIKDSEETYRVWGNDPIDACYEMILKLHESNLL